LQLCYLELEPSGHFVETFGTSWKENLWSDLALGTLGACLLKPIEQFGIGNFETSLAQIAQFCYWEPLSTCWWQALQRCHGNSWNLAFGTAILLLNTLEHFRVGNLWNLASEGLATVLRGTFRTLPLTIFATLALELFWYCKSVDLFVSQTFGT
jgi:hypothetical protein